MLDILKELTNSDVFISIEENTQDIRLRFVSTWIPENGILLKCLQVHHYQFSCHPKRNPPYPLGEVNISEDIFKNIVAPGWSVPQNSEERDWKAWVLDMKGLIEIRIVCLDLEWDIPQEYISPC